MSNKPDSFMPFWIGDYLANTMTLNTQQHGAYVLLLFAYWQNGGPLPDDDEALANITRLSQSDWFAIRKVLGRLPFFRVDGGLWIQKRADEELVKATATYEARRKAGASGNAKRWGGEKGSQKDRNAIAGGSQPQPHSFLPSERKEGGVPPAQTNSAGETPPGWETKYPKTWQQVRNEVGDRVWDVWFSNLTPASEREIVCTTPFQVSEVPHRYEKILVKHGLDDARFVLEKKPTGSPGRAVNGLAATSGAE